MRFRTHMAAAAAVTMLVGLAACGGDDDAATGTSATTTDTAESASDPTPTPGAEADAGHSAGSHSMITMNDNNFTPVKLTVAPGTKIMITNEGAALHNLKDKDTKGSTFASGDVASGADGSVTAPDKAGSYPYECTYHFGMEGTLTVK